jgi:2-polyprenyl-3-methyl-5-hydroxy-6-metoxy-1,4-benzoquinol methylase
MVSGTERVVNVENRLAEKEYWEKSYSTLKLSKISGNDPIAQWIEKYMPGEKGTCFEIGCYPGRYLPLFGDHGFELNGLDLYRGTEKELPQWLRRQGYRTGTFITGDFSDYHSTEAYDVVCSFGFIEHFIDFQSAIVKHVELVKPNGYLMVTTPNFRGTWQHRLHNWFDRENLHRHNILSMNPDLWRAILLKENFEIIYHGYFGEFDFWVDRQKRNWIQKKAIKMIQHAKPLLRKILPANRERFAPYCGLVAKRKSS